MVRRACRRERPVPTSVALAGGSHGPRGSASPRERFRAGDVGQGLRSMLGASRRDVALCGVVEPVMFDVNEPEFAADPSPALRRLREIDPVHFEERRTAWFV